MTDITRRDFVATTAGAAGENARGFRVMVD
jgi:hypothetical protein